MRVFIGSSGERRNLVEWLNAIMMRDYPGVLEPVPWTMPWPGGRFTLENLLRFVDNTDAAILFWTADDKTWYRETQRFEPRDNLLFEAGLFIAAHGRDRTQLGSISGEWDLNSEVLTDHGVWTGTLAATTQ